MNISNPFKRKPLFAQEHQIDAALGTERIITIIRSDEILRVDSDGSWFGRTHTRSVHREQHRRHNRNCIARERRITISDDGSSVNSILVVTSSLFSRQDILARSKNSRGGTIFIFTFFPPTRRTFKSC